MALFTKKKGETNLPTYQNQNLKTAVDRIIFDKITTDEDKYIIDLATDLLNGKPLVLNFEDIDTDGANKTVAFLSGVIFACDGRIEEIGPKIFLFARSQEFKDGTLKNFINEYKS
ncbi:MAG: cell division protein SepF [Acholeplasmatales bacterium]